MSNDVCLLELESWTVTLCELFFVLEKLWNKTKEEQHKVCGSPCRLSNSFKCSFTAFNVILCVFFYNFSSSSSPSYVFLLVWRWMVRWYAYRGCSRCLFRLEIFHRVLNCWRAKERKFFCFSLFSIPFWWIFCTDFILELNRSMTTRDDDSLSH